METGIHQTDKSPCRTRSPACAAERAMSEEREVPRKARLLCLCCGIYYFAALPVHQSET